MANAPRGEPHLRCTHGAHEATQSNVSWRERAGAMGGGTATSFRCRSTRVITASWVSKAPMSHAALGEIGEEIIQRQAFFIGLLVDAEQDYSRRINQLRETEDLSYAAAENKAKTEEAYEKIP